MPFRLTWINENNEIALTIRVFFVKDQPHHDGEQCTPYLDEACTISMVSTRIEVPDVITSKVEPWN